MILGHGGSVLQICPDESPSDQEEKDADGLAWMSINDISSHVSLFSRQLRERQKFLRLLYLQSCCRASVNILESFIVKESYASLSDVFVLAAQTILGV